MIQFKAITEDNFQAIVQMKRPEEEHFVSSNLYSLAQAWLYRDAGDVHPFAIYNGDEPVGFMMLDEDDDGSLVIWRIMFPEEHTNKGYGSEAIRKIISLARESGKYPRIVIDYVEGNDRARHVYEKLGFRDTGEVENNEHVLELIL